MCRDTCRESPWKREKHRGVVSERQEAKNLICRQDGSLVANTRAKERNFKKEQFVGLLFFVRPFKGQKFIQSIIFSFRHTESLQAAMFKLKKKYVFDRN